MAFNSKTEFKEKVQNYETTKGMQDSHMERSANQLKSEQSLNKLKAPFLRFHYKDRYLTQVFFLHK